MCSRYFNPQEQQSSSELINIIQQTAPHHLCLSIIQPEQGKQIRTASTGRSRQDSRDSTAREGKRQRGQDSQDRTAGTGQPKRDSQDCQDRIPMKDCQDMTAERLWALEPSFHALKGRTSASFSFVLGAFAFRAAFFFAVLRSFFGSARERESA